MDASSTSNPYLIRGRASVKSVPGMVSSHHRSCFVVVDSGTRVVQTELENQLIGRSPPSRHHFVRPSKPQRSSSHRALRPSISDPVLGVAPSYEVPRLRQAQAGSRGLALSYATRSHYMGAARPTSPDWGRVFTGRGNSDDNVKRCTKYYRSGRGREAAGCCCVVEWCAGELEVIGI